LLDLFVLAFDDETTAFEMRDQLIEMQTEYLLDMDDMVIVTHNAAGKIKLHQSRKLVLAGATSGALLGTLVGCLLLNPLLGLAAGTGAGVIAGALGDTGINDHFIRDVSAKLAPGSSAIFLLIRDSKADKIAVRLSSFTGRCHLLQSSLSFEQEAILREQLEHRPNPSPLEMDVF
jgi:uncharacterized membrane protein